MSQRLLRPNLCLNFRFAYLILASRSLREAGGDRMKPELCLLVVIVCLPNFCPDSDSIESTQSELEFSVHQNAQVPHDVCRQIQDIPVFGQCSFLYSRNQVSTRMQRPTTTTPSLLSALLPNPQGQGPQGSAIRIALELRQQSFLFRLFGGPSGSGARRRAEEMRGKFPPSSHFPSDPRLAYDSLSHHAALTGNASSQALLAFFHATAYADVVPIDQAQALLYYTFAAQGGHKGAQMALGYRYWSGISTVEDCGRAVEWYEAAADEAMPMFLSGPPGGQTLPQTATWLSDLDGGVFEPGAIVASTDGILDYMKINGIMKRCLYEPPACFQLLEKAGEKAKALRCASVRVRPALAQTSMIDKPGLQFDLSAFEEKTTNLTT
ncbi:hypothetical protein BDR06DRAFT_970767 [Suillus hirtellus]|nr:hypothetical protein BDR06DRAFT_970767 [Suillus hirtellus]